MAETGEPRDSGGNGRAAPRRSKGPRAQWSPGAETAPGSSGALAGSALLFFFFWRLVEAQDVASRDAKGYECCGQSEPDNYLCNGQRFAHTAKTIIEGFADQRGVFPGGIFEQSSRIFPSCPQGGVQAFLCEVFGLLTPSGLIAIEASFPLFELLSELGFPTTNLGFEVRHETLMLGVVGVLDVLNQLGVICAV